MKTVTAFIVFTIALFLGDAGIAHADTYRVPVQIVRPLSPARIEVPRGYDSVVIDEVRVEGSARLGEAKLVVTQIGFDPRADDYVNVRVNSITSTATAQPPELNLWFQRISVGRLFIDHPPGSAAGVDPLISVKFTDATAANVVLNGGRYGEIRILLNRNWRESDDAGRAASVTADGVTFQSLFLAGYQFIVPVNIAIRGQTSDQGSNTVELNKLQILGGEIVLGRPPAPQGATQPPLNQICQRDDQRLTFTLMNSQIGVVTEAPMRDGDHHASFRVRALYNACTELSLVGVETDGELRIEGGIFNLVAIDGLRGTSNRGDLLELHGIALTDFRMLRASIDRLRIIAEDQENFGRPEITAWGSVVVTGVLEVPSEMYSAFDHYLRDHRQAQSTVSGLRTFLVDTRWRGFIAERDHPFHTGQSAASRSLYIVLRNDARRIYGAVGAGIIDWFTGFGMRILKPIVIALIYLILPLLVAAAMNPQRRTRTFAAEYARQLVHRKDTPALPWGLVALMDFQRILFLLQVTLISLFIQNAVLVGP